jgi:hypothetical protein
MKGRTQIFIAAALMAVARGEASGTNYFVSPTGDDSHTGNSASPWSTLQHAADAVHAGDFVTVVAGNYTGFYLDTSGTAVAPIEFFAQPGVVINHQNGTTPDGINLEGASYVVIDGFTVSGMPRAGVRSVGDSDALAKFVTVRHVTATNNGEWGIFTGFVDDLLIESNSTSGSVDQHGIYVSNSGDRPIIRNNISFNNHDNGIHMNGDASEGGDGIISGAVVTGNIIYNNGTGGGSGINMDGVQNSVITNNLLYNNHASGISLYRIDGGGGSSGNIVANNTIIEANDARWDLNIQTGSTNNMVRNNILLNNNGSHGAIDISADSLAGFSSDYNVVTPKFAKEDVPSFLNLAQWQGAGYDAHSFVASADQLFAQSAANDYHLKTGSPALNSGTSFDAPAADLEGLPRPAGGFYDIGAYELGALAGDYNRDGAVNEADYVLWRNTLGSVVTRFAGADGDGSGVIDQADYARWRSDFGAVSGGAGSAIGAAAIPEPATLAEFCLVMTLFSATRQMSRRF